MYIFHDDNLVLSFITAIIMKALQDLFIDKKANCCSAEALWALGNQKCRAFDHVIIPSELFPAAGEVMKIAKLKCPKEIAIERPGRENQTE